MALEKLSFNFISKDHFRLFCDSTFLKICETWVFFLLIVNGKNKQYLYYASLIFRKEECNSTTRSFVLFIEKVF